MTRQRFDAQILTLLDAAAVTPQDYWSERMKATVDVLLTVVHAFHAVKKGFWRSNPAKDSVERRLARCNDYAFVQRLISNECRLHGKSLDEYTADMRQIREEVGIPVDFDLAEELRQIEIRYHQ